MIFVQFTSMLVEIGIDSTIVQLHGQTKEDERAASILVFINAAGDSDCSSAAVVSRRVPGH